MCDEINSRGEFLTAYAGEPYEDKGRFQALFEYESMMGELLNMDVVNVPNYDGFQAAGTALLMAGRITGRAEALICGTISGDKLSKVRDYIQPHLEPILLNYAPDTGLIDLADLKAKISDNTAAVFFENPSYLGFLETQAAEIAQIAHENGALCVVYADPLSLGVVNPPVEYGGDIVCGDIQPLGIHMWYGGGHGGFIATRDEPQVRVWNSRRGCSGFRRRSSKANTDLATWRMSAHPSPCGRKGRNGLERPQRCGASRPACISR